MLGALLLLGLALVGQSPGFMKRVGLSGSQLKMRVRALTGYAFALMLLTIGFFVAGVPLGSVSEPAAAANGTAPSATEPVDTAADEPPVDGSPVVVDPSVTPATPVTGAFGGPPASRTVSPTSTAVITAASTEAAFTPAATEPAAETTAPTATPAATTAGTPAPTTTATSTPTPQPTSTATPTPTTTPTPTLTPTPIDGETAVVDTGGSTVWLYRSPGGQSLVLLRDGDIVIVLSGRANQGGILWREIQTVDGIVGWLQEEFLNFDN